MSRVKWPIDVPPKHPGRPRKPRHPRPAPAPPPPADPSDERRCTCGHVERVHVGGMCHGWDGPFASGCHCTEFVATEPGPASD